ncbi:MAG TPA: DMT family transporter [Bacteroidales bacterium]|nr:DMT family transporter [Bacteroidales bacterium]HOK99021.1 DMT family transporter [Bacteroidales bacterium]HPO65856.1 DMT family transporter [Bacteroidales bacterium]
MRRKQLFGVYASILISMICWSLSFIWYKGAYMHYGPITTIFLRLLISSVILLLFTFIVIRPSIQRRHLKLFFAAALFEPFLYFIGESYGLKWVSPVTASVIVATIPLFTPLAGKILYDETLSKKNLAGMFISFLGVCLVVISGDFQIKAQILGVLLMFLAVFSAVGYAIALRRLTPLYDSITIIAIQNLLGMLLFLPLLFMFENPLVNPIPVTLDSLRPVLYLAIFASSIAFILYAFAVSKIGIGKTSVFINLIPILTSVFAYLVLNESFTTHKIIGVLIVVAGLLFTQWELIFKKG